MLCLQVNDLELVVRKFIQQTKARNQNLASPVKVTRSVGLQINMSNSTVSTAVTATPVLFISPALLKCIIHGIRVIAGFRYQKASCHRINGGSESRIEPTCCYSHDQSYCSGSAGTAGHRFATRSSHVSSAAEQQSNVHVRPGARSAEFHDARPGDRLLRSVASRSTLPHSAAEES